MNKLLLPAQIHPPRIKKDGSCSISFDSRELSGEEYMMILGYRNTEGYLLYSVNPITDSEIEEVPQTNDLDTKSHSKRLRSVLYILYKQGTENGYVGTFETFYSEKMEAIIGKLKDKIED